MDLIYPKAEWRTIDTGLFANPNVGMGPSGIDIWLYYPATEVESAFISDYINWSGRKAELKELKKDGATHWAPKQKPEMPC
jgi:hypothetical protein